MSYKMNSVRTTEKKSKRQTEIENVIQRINEGVKVMVLLRGLPGSGKSTLGHYILKNTVGDDDNAVKHHLLSTDDYFIRNGLYNYNPMLISDAHGWNQQRALGLMTDGYSPVIIDNTNIQMWEMKPYASLATVFGYFLDILEPDTHWCFNDKELAKRNKHNVPKATIRNMMERYDRNVTSMKLLAAYDIRYKDNIPPLMRSHPPLKSKSTTPTINLMDFNDSVKKSHASTSKPDDSTSVDNLLMHREYCAASVLQPIPSKASTNLFENIKIWGVDEEALNSWDIVTPLKENNGLDKTDLFPAVTIEDDDLEIKDNCTTTEDKYFTDLSNILCSQDMDVIKIRDTCSRDINTNFIPKQIGMKRKLMLDKSCMTDDFIGDYQAQLEQLVRMFPNVSLTNIEHWYNKCNRDINWTIDFFLNEKGEALNVSRDKDEATSSTEKDDNVISVDIDSDTSNTDRECPKLIKSNRKPVTLETLELKRCLESKITISDDHYSDALLKVKQFKFGQNSDKMAEVKVYSYSSSSSSSVESPEQIYLSDEPFEFIDIDNNEASSNSAAMNQLETIELNLGESFVNQLEQKFGDPNLVYPRGFQTQVQVPVSLARQLYAFYVESVYQQMDVQNNLTEVLLKEDEEFARQLQEDENRAVLLEEEEEKPQMDIPQIMREERRKNKWLKEVEKWKDLNPKTLAAMMTQDKLFKAFPTIEKNVLLELLHAHGNCYKDTVEILLNNTDKQNIVGDIQSIKDPPLSEDIYCQMKEDYDECHNREDASEITTGRDYRDEANKHLKKRADLYQKAQRCFQKGMMGVAQFYSGLAFQETKLYDDSNSKAVTAFLDEHSDRLQNFNTLDLHFLYVKEAIPSLDVFLDRNINLLRYSKTKTKEYLQIITGRGKHSHKGKSVLGPAIKNHLTRRELSFTNLNQGMLQVKISKKSKKTCEL